MKKGLIKMVRFGYGAKGVVYAIQFKIKADWVFYQWLTIPQFGRRSHDPGYWSPIRQWVGRREFR